MTRKHRAWQVETGYRPPVTAALYGLPGGMNEWARAEQVGVTRQAGVGGSRDGLAQVAWRWDIVRPVCKVFSVYNAIYCRSLFPLGVEP